MSSSLVLLPLDRTDFDNVGSGETTAGHNTKVRGPGVWAHRVDLVDPGVVTTSLLSQSTLEVE